MPASEITLAELLKSAGYHTVAHRQVAPGPDSTAWRPTSRASTRAC